MNQYSSFNQIDYNEGTIQQIIYMTLFLSKLKRDLNYKHLMNISFECRDIFVYRLKNISLRVVDFVKQNKIKLEFLFFFILNRLKFKYLNK